MAQKTEVSSSLALHLQPLGLIFFFLMHWNYYIKCPYTFWGICIHVYVSVWVSWVSCSVLYVVPPLYVNCNCQHQGKGHFSLHIQWHGMPNTPSDSWEIVMDMENSCLFLPLFFFCPFGIVFTHIPTYVTCGVWIRECKYVHSDVYGPQGLFVSVYVVSILLLDCH